jgi:hypothetical protein
VESEEGEVFCHQGDVVGVRQIDLVICAKIDLHAAPARLHLDSIKADARDFDQINAPFEVIDHLQVRPRDKGKDVSEVPLDL